MAKVTRLISATKKQISKMTPMELKESMYRSEGRVVMAQCILFETGLVRGVTNAEVMGAFGADMILLNAIDLDDPGKNLGLQGLSIKELKELVNRPIGVYLSCPGSSVEEQIYPLDGMIATDEHVEKVLDMGADFIILGGNPATGTRMSEIIKNTKLLKDKFGDRLLLFSGKWEDGIEEKVLGDPLAKYDTKEVIKQLIDAGADVIDLPAPGSRNGISVEDIRELVKFVHSYKPGTLAMTFLNSSVEGADPETIRLIALKMKETGADIHAIGDGGFSGCPCPENVMQLSVSLKGKPYTYFRMASVNR